LMLCPTRRPERFRSMVKSVLETSKRADVAAYVDHTDIDKYRMMHESLGDRVKWMFGEAMGNNPHPHRGSVWCANALAGEFREYALYGFIPDDALVNTPGWDERLFEMSADFPNDIGMIDVPFGGEPKDGGSWKFNAPVVSRKWIDTVGWYCPPRFNHWCWPECMGLIGESTYLVRPLASEVNVEHFNDSQEAQYSQASESPGVYEFITEEYRRAVNALREAMA
jgi:hypothetical protein